MENEASAVQSVTRPAERDREAARPEAARPRPSLGLLQRGGDGCRRQGGAAGWLGAAVRRPGPLSGDSLIQPPPADRRACAHPRRDSRSEEHTSELQSLMSISYAVFSLKKN